MAKKKRSKKKDPCCSNNSVSMGNTTYCLGLIGAAVYYISHAANFWAGVMGVLKALVWPAFLVYELLKFFKM